MTTRGASGDEIPGAADARVRVGISSCLLGEQVRHDGGHKLEPPLAAGLAPWVEWVPVCPEAEVGMGVPREPVRLVADAAGASAPRMVGVRSGRDWTAEMSAWAARRIATLRAARVHGFVLKADSPSCGVTRVEVARDGGDSARAGRGLWAAALMAADPSLPVEDEVRLRDAALREDFLRRVRTHAGAPR